MKRANKHKALRTAPDFILSVCMVAFSLSHVLLKVKYFSCPIWRWQGLVFLWNSGHLVVLQSQLSDGHKKNHDFVDYLAFSPF